MFLVVFLSTITRVQVPGREKPPTRCPNDPPATAEAARFKQKGRTKDWAEDDEMDSEDELDSVKDSYYPGLFTKVLHIPMYEPGFENKVRGDESHRDPHGRGVGAEPRRENPTLGIVLGIVMDPLCGKGGNTPASPCVISLDQALIHTHTHTLMHV